MAHRSPVRTASKALSEVLRDRQHELAAQQWLAVVVLGPALQGAPHARQLLAVHPLDAHAEAAALARGSAHFGAPAGAAGTPQLASYLLDLPASADESEADARWRHAWLARGAQGALRVGFALPAGRSFECFVFVPQPLEPVEAALLAWRVHGLWPALRAALVDAFSPLTPRELQCLQLAFEGLTARASAQRMDCTERTVNFHLANAMAKLDADNKITAIQRACWLGLL